uniref:Nuclear pore complex protein NUP1 n=1 Tax=Kalanchoe fedtschenkoi TaxID=63787 RepID=A0A7N0VI64_KALFE
MTSTFGGGGTGAGGKIRRHPPRRQQSTPYARPPTQLSKSQITRTLEAGASSGGWLSRIVDPAYRLISGSATRFLPSFLSKSSSTDSLPSSHHDTDEDACCEDPDHTTDLGSFRLLEEAGPSRAENKSILDMKQDNKDGVDNESGLSKIEQLMRGKLFSRDEVNRLTEILHARADGHLDDPGEMSNQSKMMPSDPSIDLSANALSRLLPEQRRENSNNVMREPAATTPLRRPTLLEEVGASPVDIARAYMGNISAGIGTTFRSRIHDDTKSTEQKGGLTSMSMVQPSMSKPSICWPGATVQEHRAYLTPQNPRSKFGLYSSQRSPYSRTINSEKKLKLTPSVGRHTSLHVSETPSRQNTTICPTQQGMEVADASVNGLGSVGPIRSKRHNKVAHSPFRGSTLVASSNVQKSIADSGTLLTENMQYTQKTKIQSAHPHSSQIARIILDHIDRKVPSLREKSEEIRIARTGWETSPSKLSTPSLQQDRSALSNGFTSRSFDIGSKKLIPALSGIASYSTQAQGGDAGSSDSPKNNASPFNSSTANEEGKGGKSYTCSVSNHVGGESSSKTGFGAAGSELPTVLKTQQSLSSGNKPALASISVNRPNPKSVLSIGSSSGFTFPVPASSGLLSEPPTPSITPAKVSPNVDEGLSTPLYTFGSKKPSPGLVFSFASSSSFSDRVDDSDVKFNFGSDRTSRISFSSVIKDTIAH